jgi:hypothetical protein
VTCAHALHSTNPYAARGILIKHRRGSQNHKVRDICCRHRKILHKTMPPFNNEIEPSRGIMSRIRSRDASFSSVATASGAESSKQHSRVSRVRFYDQVRVRDIMSRKEYTEQEIRDCWCSRYEFNEIRRNVASTAYLMANKEHHQLLDDVMYTSRGSHCRLESVSKRRCELRRQTRAVVLGQQADQKKRGKRDDGAIATAYSKIARSAAMDARAMASLDEKDARLYLTTHASGDYYSDDCILSSSCKSYCIGPIIEDCQYSGSRVSTMHGFATCHLCLVLSFELLLSILPISNLFKRE